mgnify:CR=1 FL=1
MILKNMKKIKISSEIEVTFDDILLIPQYSEISFEDIDKKIDISSKLTKTINIKIPIVSSPMASVTELDMALLMAEMGGIGIIHSFMDKNRQIYQIRKFKQIYPNLLVGAAVYDGLTDLFSHVENLIKEKADVIVLDTYHAYNKRTLEVVKRLKNKFGNNIQLIVGNVVTKEATKTLCKFGADGIKVGIGPGSHCTTRLVTGCGRPQITSIYECAIAAKKFKVPIMADGGINFSGDIVKALFFGANTVMLGGLLAGCDQSPGEIIYLGEKKYKKTFGNCSKELFLKQKKDNGGWFKNFKRNIKNIFFRNLIKNEIKEINYNFIAEGVSGLIEYKGDGREIIKNIVGGLKRGFWYLGVSNINQLHNKKKDFCLVSFSTLKENAPRNLKLV